MSFSFMSRKGDRYWSSFAFPLLAYRSKLFGFNTGIYHTLRLLDEKRRKNGGQREKSICDFEQMKREMAVSKIVYACGSISMRVE